MEEQTQVLQLPLVEPQVREVALAVAAVAVVTHMILDHGREVRGVQELLVRETGVVLDKEETPVALGEAVAVVVLEEQVHLLPRSFSMMVVMGVSEEMV